MWADALAIAKQVLQGEGQRFLLLKTAYVLLGLDLRTSVEFKRDG